MGGRGANSKIGSQEKISPMAARIAFNAAKKNSSPGNAEKRNSEIEKAIKAGKTNILDNAKTEQQARKNWEYLLARRNENDRKITKLGSAEKLQKNTKLYNEHRNITKLLVHASEKMKTFRNGTESERRYIENKTITTTYDRARARRIKNFDDWFGR